MNSYRNIKKYLLITTLTILFTVPAFSLDLRKGIMNGHTKWQELTSVDHEAGYFPKAVVESDEEGVVFVLDDSIGKTNIQTGELLGGWPLTRWAHEYQESNIENSYLNGYFSNPYSRDVYIDESDRLTHLMGCMQRTPLRYGDVTGNGQSELVVLLADEVSTDINVFSPSLQKTIFSAKLNFTDSVPRSALHPSGGVQHSEHQYLSWRNAQAAKIVPAYRAYAKLYVGDFEDNGQPDLIMWRKYYEPRRTDDTVEGFELKAQTWLHYSFVDGEYQSVDTDEATIQEWLATKELTWSQGYPRYSECEGEEGQLIPEMHDALLNDPDVLM